MWVESVSGSTFVTQGSGAGYRKVLGTGTFRFWQQGQPDQHPRLGTQIQAHFHSGTRMKLSCRLPMDLVYVLGNMKVLKIQANLPQSLERVTSAPVRPG